MHHLYSWLCLMCFSSHDPSGLSWESCRCTLYVGCIIVGRNHADRSKDNYLRLEKWVILDLFFGVTVASFPVLQGQLPKSWSLFKSYTRSYSHSRSHGTGTHPVSTSASNRRKTEIYRHDGLESKSNNFRSDVDDEIELLQQRQRKAPGNVDQPPKVLIKVDDFDSKSFKQQSRDESPESGVTGSH